MSDHQPKESPFIEGDARVKTIQGMREMADWLEAHTDVPLYSVPYMALFASWFKDEPIASSPRRLAKAMGKADKDYDSDHISLTRRFSGGLYYTFYFDREQVCEAKTVGTREKKETRYQVGDQLLTYEELQGLKTEVVVGEEPIIEYVCPESLLSQAS